MLSHRHQKRRNFNNHRTSPTPTNVKNGDFNRAKLPLEVHPSGYGKSSGSCHRIERIVSPQPKDGTQSAMQDIFGISMSLGTVNNLRLEASMQSKVLSQQKYIRPKLPCS